MEIYLIRHTTPKIEKGICYGQTNLDLAENHKDAFKAILETVPKGNYNVFSSPLKRCALLAEAFKETIIYDDRLKELNFGNWEMQPWDAIPKKAMALWMNDFVNAIIPNGESYTQLALRVNDFFSTIEKSTSNKNHIIVAHAGVIRAYLSTLLNISLKESFSIPIEYGEVFKLKKERNSIKILSEIKLKTKH